MTLGTDDPATTPAAPADPLEDGRTRCSWVRGHTGLYLFHDAEWGMVPDMEDLSQERLLLAAFQRWFPLPEVLGFRGRIYDDLHHWDLEKIAAMDDAAIDALVRGGGLFADRDRMLWIRDVAAAGAATAKAMKGIREYYLAIRFQQPEEQFQDMIARFPGFTRVDASNLMEMVGAGAGGPHERDCWRA